MGAPKNNKFLLSQEETLAFKKRLKELKIKQKEFAEAICMSEPAFGVALKNFKAPKFWFEFLKVREEVNCLRSALQKFRELAGKE